MPPPEHAIAVPRKPASSSWAVGSMARLNPDGCLSGSSERRSDCASETALPAATITTASTSDSVSTHPRRASTSRHTASSSSGQQTSATTSSAAVTGTSHGRRSPDDGSR